MNTEPVNYILAADAHQGIALITKFADLPLDSTLQTLYDEYRIHKIVVKFYTQLNAFQNSAAGHIESAIDWDDKVVPENNALQFYATFRRRILQKTLTYTYRPKIMNVMRAAVGSAMEVLAPQTSPWIDMAYPAAEHLGMKFYIVNGGQAQTIEMRKILYLSCRNIR